MMRYLFIINSKANPKELRRLDDAIADLEDDIRSRIELRYTDYPGHCTDMAIEASDRSGDKVTIVACGGDGTIHEAVNALAHRNTPLIIVPMGTGNDFARTVLKNDYRKKPMSIIKHLDEVKYIPIDLVRLDSYDVLGSHLPVWSRYFANVASIGLDTKVQACAKSIVAQKDTSFNRKTAYFQAIFRLLKGNESFRLSYSLEIDGGDVNEVSENEEFTLISICNGRYYGGGFCPAPDAKIDDGVLDICIIEKASLLYSIHLLSKYRFGGHVGKSGVRTFRATSGIITCQDGSFQLQGNYDGEDFFGHRIRFEVFPEALRIGVLPEN